MTISLPAFTDDQAFPFWYLRKMMSTVASPGIVDAATDFIVSPASGLQVQVTSGCAFVQQTVNIEGSSAYDGLYMILNDATANPYNTISAPIANPRIDQVILRVYDVKEQGLGGSSFARLEWLEGSENASASLTTMGPGLSNPGAASLPANSLQHAYVLQTVGESSISSGNILNVAPSSSKIGCRVHLSTSFAISAANFQYEIPFDTADYDTNQGFNRATHAYIVPAAGFYTVSLMLSLAGGTDSVFPYIYRNGSQQSAAGLASEGNSFTDSYLYAKGDSLTFYVSCNAASQSLQAGPAWTVASIARIS